MKTSINFSLIELISIKHLFQKYLFIQDSKFVLIDDFMWMWVQSSCSHDSQKCNEFFLLESPNLCLLFDYFFFSKWTPALFVQRKMYTCVQQKINTCDILGFRREMLFTCIWRIPNFWLYAVSSPNDSRRIGPRATSCISLTLVTSSTKNVESSESKIFIFLTVLFYLFCYRCSLLI